MDKIGAFNYDAWDFIHSKYIYGLPMCAGQCADPQGCSEEEMIANDFDVMIDNNILDKF